MPIARKLKRFALAAAILTAAGGAAFAQSTAPYPSKPVHVVVTFPPGGSIDVVPRIVAQKLIERWGQPWVFENRPGAGGQIAVNSVLKSPADGYTLLVGPSGAIAVNPTLYKKLAYDPVRDLAPIVSLARTPMVLVVQGSSPYKTLDDLIAAARAKPGSVVFASGGPASSLHVAIEVLKRAAKIDATYVPYGGNAPAINALLGGHVTAVWADYPTVVAHLQSGTLRGLVTTAAKRVATLPAVPTLIETGLSNYEADIFYGIVAPAKTPPPTLAKLAGWFMNAIKAPEMAPKLAKHGVFPVGICGPEFGAYLKRMVDDYSRIIAEANIKAN